MKIISLFFLSFLLSICAYTQSDSYCGLGKIFSLNSGSSKEEVIDTIKKNYDLVAMNDQIINNTESAQKNAVNKEVLIYSVKNTDCFNGNNTSLRFEFINNKLVKAFMQTEFARSDYYDMIDNFNKLRSVLKQEWKHEKQIKNYSENLISTGFDYTKAIDQNWSAEKITLHYISTKPGKGYGIYLLQLNWVNTSDHDLETIVY